MISGDFAITLENLVEHPHAILRVAWINATYKLRRIARINGRRLHIASDDGLCPNHRALSNSDPHHDQRPISDDDSIPNRHAGKLCGKPLQNGQPVTVSENRSVRTQSNVVADMHF